MVGSCSRDGGSVKTASNGGDTFQGLVVMHVSSPAKIDNFCYERNISSIIYGSDNSNTGETNGTVTPHPPGVILTVRS